MLDNIDFALNSDSLYLPEEKSKQNNKYSKIIHKCHNNKMRMKFTPASTPPLIFLFLAFAYSWQKNLKI